MQQIRYVQSLNISFVFLSDRNTYEVGSVRAPGHRGDRFALYASFLFSLPSAVDVILLSLSRSSVWRLSEAPLMAQLENIVSSLLILKGKLMTTDIWLRASAKSFTIFFPMQFLKHAENTYIFSSIQFLVKNKNMKMYQ